MEWFDETVLQSFPFEHNYMEVICRLTFDTLCVTLCASLLEYFTEHINSIDPAIQFMKKGEINLTLPILDTFITREQEGKLS